LAVQQRTVFIERDPRKADRHLNEMKQRIEDGGCLVLFPEGTSSDGSRVLPFKSALFQSASIEFPETGQIEVQTVSIAYNRLDGMPMGRALRPLYTWFGDMELVPHLMGWLGLGTVGVEVVFHDPVRMADVGGRKQLAAATQSVCEQGLLTALRNAPETGNPLAEAQP
jgi:1-acyl-sn-glycerol-3-phosphate acyltransferase